MPSIPQLPDDATAQLQALLEAFVSGERRTVQDAREIEEFIAAAFPADHALQELVDLLAQYQPGGGEYLFSWDDARPAAARWLQRLRAP